MCGRLQAVKGFSHVAALVGAAMCSAFLCGSHKAAGHNAFRGSGPGQKLAFDNAVAHVGCPDRRIDQSCITCCLPLPTFYLRRSPALSRLYRRRLLPRKRDRLLVTLAWPSSPRPSWRAYWQAQLPQPLLAAAASAMSAKAGAWRRAFLHISRRPARQRRRESVNIGRQPW